MALKRGHVDGGVTAHQFSQVRRAGHQLFYAGAPWSGNLLALATTHLYFLSMARVLHWNGRNVPSELRDLPAGDYIVAEYHPHKLTPVEEEGIREAIASLDRGEGIPTAQVHARLTKIINKHRRAKSRKAKARSR